KRCLCKFEGDAARLALHMIFERVAIMRRQQPARAERIKEAGRHIRRIAIAEMIENARRKRRSEIPAPSGERCGEQCPANGERGERAELNKAAYIFRGAAEKAENKPRPPKRQHRQAARERLAENAAALRLTLLDEGREFLLEKALEALIRLRHRCL